MWAFLRKLNFELGVASLGCELGCGSLESGGLAFLDRGASLDFHLVWTAEAP